MCCACKHAVMSCAYWWGTSVTVSAVGMMVICMGRWMVWPRASCASGVGAGVGGRCVDMCCDGGIAGGAYVFVLYGVCVG